MAKKKTSTDAEQPSWNAGRPKWAEYCEAIGVDVDDDDSRNALRTRATSKAPKRTRKTKQTTDPAPSTDATASDTDSGNTTADDSTDESSAEPQTPADVDPVVPDGFEAPQASANKPEWYTAAQQIGYPESVLVGLTKDELVDLVTAAAPGD